MEKRRRAHPALFMTGLMAAMGAAFAFGGQLKKSRPARQTVTPVRVAETSERGSAARLPVPESGEAPNLSTFEQVYSLVKHNYVDKLPDDNTLSQGAVRAMVGSLEDPNSYFLSPEQRKLLEDEGKGRFAGIGAALFTRPMKQDGYTDHKLVVVAPLPGSPAEKAGLRPGDVIQRVDGKYVLGYNPLIQYIKVVEKWQNKAATDDELEKSRQATQTQLTTGIGFLPAQLLLRGDATHKEIAAKKSYTLTVQRPGVAEPLTLSVTPGITEVTPVSSKTLEGGAGYLKISALTSGAPSAVQGALAALPKSGGLVLDLRDNPGGSLAAAQKVCGLLVGPGPMAVEVGARGKKTPLNAGGAAIRKRPLTVLIGRGTGAAAEALALALSEKGATLLGEKSFGDALVQSLYKLDDGSGFTLTTGKLVSPKGTSWAWSGIAPQVVIAPGTPEAQVLARAVATLTAPVAARPAPGGRS